MMSSNLLDSDMEVKNHASFELKQLLNELQNNKTLPHADMVGFQNRKKCIRGNSRVQRLKSSLMFDYQRESL